MVELLAQLPDSAVYVSPVKLAIMALVLTAWVVYARWADRDALAVNTYRILWNLLTLAAGALAAALLLFIPVFWAGLAAFLLVNGGLATAYVLHRNGLVRDEDKILTAAHLRSLLAGKLGAGRKPPREVREKVRITAADRHVVAIPTDEVEREQFRLAQELLFDVLLRRASVVEVSPFGQTSKVLYEIDGIPTERESLVRQEGEALVLYLKKLAGLNLEERRKPQTGKIALTLADQRYDAVVRTDGSTAGEKLTLRILGDERRFKVNHLGFSDRQMEQVRAWMDAPRGVVLISGPPDSGVSTTVYSFARTHDAFLQNIQMLEYERDIEVENITQHLFTPGENRTFANDLLKIVRSDPNIVVLPELRERQAAQVISQAAAEKVKAYVALPGQDVLDALRKWIALVGDVKLVGRSLIGVTNQRLIRVLCPTCKQPYKPDAATLRKINAPEDRVLYRPPEPTFDKQGNPILCAACGGTGYMGRTGVFSLLSLDEPLKQLMRQGAPLTEIQAYILKKGGLSLQQQALQKVFEGITSIEEVVRVTRGPGSGGSGQPAVRPRPSPGATPRPQPAS